MTQPIHTVGPPADTAATIDTGGRVRIGERALDRRLALTAVALASFAVGIVSGWFAPHGPATAGQALATLAVNLIVGLVAGVLVGSRSAIPPTVLAQLAGIELARLGLAGGTIGPIRLDNTYGILAFVLGRGVHGLLIVLALSLGVLAGTIAGRRAAFRSVPGATSARPGRRPIGTAFLAAMVVGLAVAIAMPASAPPVLGEDGAPLAGSLAELTTVRLGGRDQAISIRAADPDKPVLLYLSGGPGQSDLALSRVLTTGWVRDFVVVDLDQRGNGKSYAAIDPVASMTLARAVSDILELTDYLRARFDEPKVYLMGESWGTLLGVLAVRQRPDLYFAWIGSGQMVDVVETDRRVYADLLEYARRTGDTGLASDLAAIGEPPYRDLPWANANLLLWYDYLYKDYTPSAGYRERGSASGLDPFGVLGSEYDLIEKTNVLRGLIDTFAVMYPQLYDLDLRQAAPRLDVPVYILDGSAELEGRRDLALEWYGQLDAPLKQLITYEDAAHSVAFEQADAVQRLLVDTIVPATYER